MSKTFTKLLSQHPLSNKKGLDIGTIDDKKFEFVPCLKFCQAQPQPRLQLSWAELVLVPVDPSVPPPTGIVVLGHK